MKQSLHRGFTLIELIVVIAILGVLAAVALPRFIDLQVSARQAKLSAGLGAVRAGAALFHAQCIANATTTSGACPADGTPFTVGMEGVAVNGVNQYPDTSVAGIVSAAGLSASGTATSPADYVLTVAPSLLIVDVPSPTAAKCRFAYSTATVLSGTITAPASATITDNTCN